MYRQKYLKYKAKYLELKGGELNLEEKERLEKLKSDLEKKNKECNDDLISIKSEIDILNEKSLYSNETIRYVIRIVHPNSGFFYGGKSYQFIFYSMYTDKEKITKIIQKIFHNFMNVIIEEATPSQNVKVGEKNQYAMRKNVYPPGKIEFFYEHHLYSQDVIVKLRRLIEYDL
jgi:hypothetical protein